MIITHVRAVQPDADRAPAGWRGDIGQILVRIDTDDGLSGYGVGGGGAAGIHVVQTVLREVLIGANAEDVEGLWDAMYRHTAAYGRKGIAMMAISGVDLALWDLRGKHVFAELDVRCGGQVKPCCGISQISRHQNLVPCASAASAKNLLLHHLADEEHVHEQRPTRPRDVSTQNQNVVSLRERANPAIQVIEKRNCCLFGYAQRDECEARLSPHGRHIAHIHSQRLVTHGESRNIPRGREMHATYLRIARHNPAFSIRRLDDGRIISIAYDDVCVVPHRSEYVS